MTAVANPPSFPQLSRSAWGGTISGNNPMNADEVRGMFAPRKTLSRSSSSSSISSDSSNTSIATNGSLLPNGSSVSSTSDLSQWSANGLQQRKRPQPSNPWPVGKADPQPDFSRLPNGRPNGMAVSHVSMQQGQGGLQSQMGQQVRPMGAELPPGQPVLYLLSLNGTFERKTIAVPFAPDSLRIGRQTNQKTVPTPTNGFFDSKVLSRQHAEIFAERNGKIFIRDVKSSNGTFVNGTRLSQENRESEPHELQTADHLELGIDIVSEDQKTVVHHKVAAKVEHAGFMTASNNVLDMNFGDLDPANGAMMMSAGAMQLRGRNGNNPAMGNNGRMMQNGNPVNVQGNGIMQQRPFFMAPIATDQIMKRLTAEMRNARLQAQDLTRTNQFVNVLLSKEDLKELDKHDPQEPPKPQPVINGNAVPLRTDTKARFSDPPAPPPQQPLPEKPDSPVLKRGPSERPKSGPPISSPIRQDNLSQIIQLTEALNNSKRDFELQTAKIRDLELLLQREREAREAAETLAKRLEESTHSSQLNGSIELVEPIESVESINQEIPTVAAEETEAIAEDTLETQPELKESVALPPVESDSTLFQSQIKLMETKMEELQEQLSQWQQRCEHAERERDSDRKSLAEMVTQLRAEEALRVEAEKKALSLSNLATAKEAKEADEQFSRGTQSMDMSEDSNTGQVKAAQVSTNDTLEDEASLSRRTTITPHNIRRGGATAQEHPLQASLPYASMLGVILVGMGMMAYINGWQTPPPRMER